MLYCMCVSLQPPPAVVVVAGIRGAGKNVQRVGHSRLHQHLSGEMFY